jgi:iron complex transport system permease protein
MKISSISRRLRITLWLSTALLLVFSGLSIRYGVIDMSFDAFWAVWNGTSDNQMHRSLIWHVRLPRLGASLVAGGLLSLCGLLMQNLFRNPLAGPSLLGVTSGSSLGVALITMAATAFGWHMEHVVFYSAVPIAALLGALTVLGIILLVSRRMTDHHSLLIFGVMIGYLTGALITILQSKSNADNIRAFVMWGMGSFADVSPTILGVLTVTLTLSYLLIRRDAMALNQYLLGDAYAQSMGTDVRRLRLKMVAICGVQVGLVTAYCGPVAFIGLTIPIVARLCIGGSDHRHTIPVATVLGMLAGVVCDQISIVFTLPLNAITAAMGAPMLIALLLRSKTGMLRL